MIANTANTPTNPAGDDEDQELVMAIVPLFQQHLQEAQQHRLEKLISWLDSQLL
jgi:hypothetical protein